MTQVIINDILPRTQAIATAGQTQFDSNPPWTADTETDVVVYQRAAGVDADDITQILPTSAYNVSFIGAARIVRVTLLVPASLGDVVTLIRNTPADRLNLYTNTNFTPSMLNNDFGILTLVDQQNQLVAQQIAPRYNYSELINVPGDIILPKLGPGESWVMNGAGDQILAQVAGGSAADILAQLASHAPGEGASLIGLNPTGTVQDLANVPFIVKVANFFTPNAQALGALATGILKSTTVTGLLSISAPLTSIDGLTTAADKMIYTTASNTYATTDLTPVARGLLSQTTFAGMAAVLGALSTSGGTMSGAIDMGNFQINNLANPTSAGDAVNLSYLNTQLALKLSLSGGTMTGNIIMGSNSITNLLDPVNPQDAATKNYVDSVAIGLTIQPAVYAASTTAFTVTYNNGASGIGATLTNAGALAAFSTDGTSPPVNSRILFKDQASTFQNGIYTLTNAGSGAVAWVATRATDYDQPGEIQPGDLVIVNNGTVNAGSSFIETDSVSVIGTDPIEFSQFTFSATAVLLKANNLNDVANFTTAFNNISPTTTKGDLIVDDGTNDVRLAVGTVDGQILQVSSGAATGLAYSTATYPVTTTINQILYSNATNTVVGLATTAGGVLVTNNLSVPSLLANPTADRRALFSANTAIPAWSDYAFPTAVGSTGNVMTSDGTDWISSPNPGTTLLTTKGDLFGFSTVNARIPVAVGDGKILQVDSTAGVGLSYSTAAYPVTAGAVGNVLTSDGTNFVSSAPSSSGTVSSGTINQLAWYAATGTVVSGLETANSGVLITDSSGVPSIASKIVASNLPVGTQFNTQSTCLTTTTSVTGSTFADVTGLSVAITPTSASNKVLVRVIVNASTPASDPANFQMLRGSTAIGVGAAAGSRTQAGGDLQANFLNHCQSVVMEFLDSPATTSATTYKVQALATNGGTIQINRSVTDTNLATFARTSSTITVCEVVV